MIYCCCTDDIRSCYQSKKVVCNAWCVDVLTTAGKNKEDSSAAKINSQLRIYNDHPSVTVTLICKLLFWLHFLSFWLWISGWSWKSHEKWEEKIRSQLLTAVLTAGVQRPSSVSDHGRDQLVTRCKSEAVFWDGTYNIRHNIYANHYHGCDTSPQISQFLLDFQNDLAFPFVPSVPPSSELKHRILMLICSRVCLNTLLTP